MSSTERMLRAAARLMTERMKIEGTYSRGDTVEVRRELALNLRMGKWLVAWRQVQASAKAGRARKRKAVRK